jgi:hypothetical protein
MIFLSCEFAYHKLFESSLICARPLDAGISDAFLTNVQLSQCLKVFHLQVFQPSFCNIHWSNQLGN